MSKKEERTKRKHMKHLTMKVRYYLGLKRNDMKGACLFDLIRKMSDADLRHLHEDLKDEIVRATGIDKDMLFGKMEE